MVRKNEFSRSQLFTVSTQGDVLATTLGMRPSTPLVSVKGEGAVFAHMVCSGRVTAIRTGEWTTLRCDRCGLPITVPNLVRTAVDFIHMAEKKFLDVRRVA